MTGNPTVSRRTLIAATGTTVGAVGIFAVAGCSNDESGRSEQAVRRDETVRRESLASELRLIANYEAAITAGGPDVELLAQIADQHRQHAELLRDGSVATTPIPVVPTVPTTAELADLEHEAAGLRAGASVRAGGGELAAALCWIGCSEAQHAAVLVAGR